jgi:hypothetical protein
MISLEDLKEILAPLKMSEKEIVFMPINNNQDFNQVGGTHW